MSVVYVRRDLVARILQKGEDLKEFVNDAVREKLERKGDVEK